MIRVTTDETTRVRWRQALELFEQSLSLPAREREQLLQSVGRRDAVLRQTLSDLLAAHGETETSGFLAAPAWSYQPPPESATTAPATLGQQAGVYRLTRFLDRGGMGEVYLAKRIDGMFERQVAVKLVRANLNAKEYRRFRREVQILADLKHANLVTLYDAGRLPDGRPYLVMEYVAGENLRDWLKTHPSPPRETVAEIARQACAGLHAAHQAGVIHRDIKPANLVLTAQGGQLTVKLLDFGIAYRREPLLTDQSRTGGAIGTVGYMSPEQLHGVYPELLTPASDVYSIGLVVYEMLTGQQAYAGYSQAEIMAKRFHQPLPLPRARRPELGFSATLDRVVMKALADAPAERYQTTPDFAQALTGALLETAPLTGSNPVPIPPTPSPTPMPPVGINWWKWALVGSVPILLGVSWWLWSRETTPVVPSPLQTRIETSAPSPVPPTGLRILLGVDAKGVKFDGCRFALFKPGVAASAAISPDNALVLLEEVNDGRTSKIVKEDRVPPGQYAMRFECRGFQTVAKPVVIEEDSQRPGRAIVRFDLKPE